MRVGCSVPAWPVPRTALPHTGTTPVGSEAAVEPAGLHSEGSGWGQGSRSWGHSRPSAGTPLWAGCSQAAISMDRWTKY